MILLVRNILESSFESLEGTQGNDEFFVSKDIVNIGHHLVGQFDARNVSRRNRHVQRKIAKGRCIIIIVVVVIDPIQKIGRCACFATHLDASKQFGQLVGVMRLKIPVIDH